MSYPCCTSGVLTWPSEAGWRERKGLYNDAGGEGGRPKRSTTYVPVCQHRLSTRGGASSCPSHGCAGMPCNLNRWYPVRPLLPHPRRLAALAACSGCPLTRLELHGAVPLSEAVAEAVHACCPQLASLCLDHQTLLPAYVFRGAKPDGGPEAYHHGCVRLLELCGPRIRCLQLRGVYGWRTMSYMALRHCTALTQLEMEAGFRSCKDLSVERYTGGCSPAECIVFV